MRQGFKGLEARDVQERWIDRREEYDERERKEEEERAKEAAEAAGLPTEAQTGIKIVRKKAPDAPQP